MACQEDFALVRGESVLDGPEAEERVSCLLPGFPSQAAQWTPVVSVEVGAGPRSARFNPSSNSMSADEELASGPANALGIVNGDPSVTTVPVSRLSKSTEAAARTFLQRRLVYRLRSHSPHEIRCPLSGGAISGTPPTVSLGRQDGVNVDDAYRPEGIGPPCSRFVRDRGTGAGMKMVLPAGVLSQWRRS